MRALALLALCLSVFAAGCSGNSSSQNHGSSNESTVPANETVPAPLHFQGDILVGADPFNALPLGPGMPCSQPASTCFVHEFNLTANHSVGLVAILNWSLAANDLDLYLYMGNEQISMDGINALGTSTTQQVLSHASLRPGDYQLWVSVWNGVADHYTLDVAFS